MKEKESHKVKVAVIFDLASELAGANAHAGRVLGLKSDYHRPCAASVHLCA